MSAMGTPRTVQPGISLYRTCRAVSRSSSSPLSRLQAVADVRNSRHGASADYIDRCRTVTATRTGNTLRVFLSACLNAYDGCLSISFRIVDTLSGVLGWHDFCVLMIDES
eukprot:6180448-Pleurochrysis_carterae.AAC.1